MQNCENNNQNDEKMEQFKKLYLILKNGKMLISEKVRRKTYRNENNLTNYF